MSEETPSTEGIRRVGPVWSRPMLRPAVRLLALPDPSLTGAALGGNGGILNGTVRYDTSGNETWSNGGNMLQEGNPFCWASNTTCLNVSGPLTISSSSDLATWGFANAILHAGESASTSWPGRPQQPGPPIPVCQP